MGAIHVHKNLTKGWCYQVQLTRFHFISFLCIGNPTSMCYWSLSNVSGAIKKIARTIEKYVQARKKNSGKTWSQGKYQDTERSLVEFFRNQSGEQVLFHALGNKYGQEHFVSSRTCSTRSGEERGPRDSENITLQLGSCGDYRQRKAAKFNTTKLKQTLKDQNTSGSCTT